MGRHTTHGRFSPRGVSSSAFEMSPKFTRSLDLANSKLQKRSNSRSINDAGWSSLVARRAHNPKVVSSNLTPATN